MPYLDRQREHAAACSDPSVTNRTTRTPKKRAGRDWAPAFLEALRQTGNVTSAVALAGIGRRTAYDRRQRDEEFAIAWRDVDEEVTDAMERELYRRAVEGVEEPIFHQGKEIATIRRYSDTLLIFALKARKPNTYRENVRVQHGGKIRHEPRTALGSINPVDLTPEEQDALALLAECERARAGIATARDCERPASLETTGL